MVLTLENKYKIKWIVKSEDEDFSKALKIYSQETSPEMKTNTNEITYWIDNADNSKNFSFMLFVIYLDEEIIGYIQASYFKKNKFMLIDYMTFKDPFRINAVFFPSLSLLKELAKKNDWDINYWITEIGNQEDGKVLDKESLFLKQLISFENFGEVNIDYYQPYLGSDNFESSLQAKLYVKANDQIKKLSKDTVINIVKTIYFSYYFEWYKPFMNQQELQNYKLHLDSLLLSVEKGVGNTDPIVINHIPSKDILTQPEFHSTAGSVPAKKIRSKFFYPTLIFAPFIGPVAFLILFQFVLSKFDIMIEGGAVGAVFGALISSFASVAVIVWTNSKSKKE
ncbi:hypothetical protein [Saccharibacillus brassicae]|uniref:Uncharacterized protein n=1 Tax=Saccharibacillus brassicae TaxID=2583377 RepID=A0A4Y6URZ5_SACBS|nr:hypothetical protein [Saccharibacillus brassicae]QDH20433.1 hypothetical protein FFV09_05905 [Saccharibacillus brassicae]